MRFDKLFEPVSAAEPSGPDLEDLGDTAYLTYTLAVEDRLPASYFDKQTGRPIDRSTLDLRAETSQIGKLLEKSRDLRLLTTEARFQALAGQIVGFSECLQAMAGLCQRFWDSVHPQPYEGDYLLRQNTVAGVASLPTVILPLQFATIVQDRRHGAITYRHFAAANGDVEAVPGMAALSLGDIAGTLSSPANAEAVAQTHAALAAALAALDAMTAAFVEGAGYDYVPDFDPLIDMLRRIRSFVESNVPALAPASAGAEATGTDEAAEASDAVGASGGAAPAVGRVGGPAAAVADQASAKAALTAAERYFSRNETSSPALILVSQARQLIGKPFVVALQALVNDRADRAVIRIDPDSGFQLDMDRMRDLTDASAEAVDGGDAEEISPPPSYPASTRAEAVALLLGVEAFMKSAEPSSPVPLLLEKARGFLNQDFRSILKTLLPIER